MRSRVLAWLKLGMKFALAFGILWYMVWKGKLDLGVVRQGFAHADYLVGAACLVLLALTLSLYRWRLLLEGQGIHLSGRQILRYGMIGYFFNTTMPGAVSGDLIKAWYVIADRKGQKKTPVVTSIFLDRAMGVFGLVIVSASPVLFFWPTVWAVPELRHVAATVLALFVGVVLFFCYIMLSTWGPLAYLRRSVEPVSRWRGGQMLLQAYDAWVGYRRRPGILLLSLLISVINHLCLVSVIILFARSIGEGSLAPLHYFLLVPIGLLATALPVAPAGLGVGHAAFGWLFSLAGSHHGPEVFTMLVTIQIIFNLTGVFFYLGGPKPEPQPAL